MNNVNENTKADWMNIVKKHRKRQKGLPALSTLNTNAGDVEKNIEMFNNMQPDGSVTADAVNGNVSSNTAVCEELDDNFDMSMRTLL